MTTSIFTGLIIKSAWTPGLSGGSFPKLISKHRVLGSLVCMCMGLILPLHIWALPALSHGLQWDCPSSEFDEYHIFLCIARRLSIKTVIPQQCGLQAYVSYVRGSLLWGPLFPRVPLPLIPAPFASFTPTASDSSLLWVLPCPPHLWCCVVCEKPSGDAFSNVNAF